jgi:hypothetical protein
VSASVQATSAAPHIVKKTKRIVFQAIIFPNARRAVASLASEHAVATSPLLGV